MLQNKMNKLLIIIPAYNESASIEKVIEGLKENYSFFDYIIINDGSKDDTARICKEHNYHIVDLPVNLGLSGAFQTGLKYACENGYDYVIQFDADGQHRPEYIKGMLDCIQNKNVDMVIGSRFVSEKKPISVRMFGSNLISLLIRLTTGKKIMDPTSGMRLFNRKVIQRMAYDMDMPPEPDTVAYLIKCGASVEEFQVRMQEREEGESYLTFSNSIKYMWKMCFSILVLSFFRNRRKL